MKDGGKTTKLTEREDLFMLMAIFTRVIGKMTKLMDLESLNIKMVQNIKVNGLKINSMVL